MKFSYVLLLCSTLLSGKLVAQSNLSDTCKVRFTMRSATNCGVYAPPPAPDLRNIAQVILLGNRLTDGIRWSGSTTNTPVQELRARTGVRTAPTGVSFRACAGNWAYYELSGWDVFKAQVGPSPTKRYYDKIHARVKILGSEQQPDSLYLEFAQNQVINSGNLYLSSAKDKFCFKSCALKDVTPPTLHVGNTTVLKMIVPARQPIYSDSIRKYISLSAGDNCHLNHQGLYPNRLDSFKVGQVVHYQYVAFDAVGNRSVSVVRVQFDTLRQRSDTCRLKFNMNNEFIADCRYTPAAPPPFYIIKSTSLTLLGKTLTDGIAWQQGGVRVNFQLFYARVGSRIPPVGVRFSNCVADWVYYTLSGNTGYNGSHSMPSSLEITGVHARVRLFGQLPNPDSLHIEFAENESVNAKTLYRSVGQEFICAPNFNCAGTDFTPPTYKNCPKPQDKPFQVTLDFKPYLLGSKEVEQQLPLPITLQDNCGTERSNLYPFWAEQPKVGEPINYHYVGYDKGGNKTICNFKVLLAVKKNDLAVSLTANPSTWQYEQNTTIPYEVTIDNRSDVAHTNIRIQIPFPANTVSQTPPQPSMGVWKEICANGTKCYEWQIPHLPTNTTATLKIPLFVGATTADIVTTATLLSATPADDYLLNNQYSHTATYFAAVPNQSLSPAKEAVSENVTSLNPNPTENAFTLATHSLVEGEQTFDIFNVFGQHIVSENKILQKGQNELFFDVSRLGKGVYFIQQRTQTGQTKFIKL